MEENFQEKLKGVKGGQIDFTEAKESKERNQVSLPIKTKIAAWWMIIIGGALGLMGLSFPFSPSFYGNFVVAVVWGIIVALPGLLVFISGFQILKRKKLAWWLIVIGTSIILTLLLLMYRSYTPPIFILSVLIPLIFLLLDRKNFWKIAS